MSSRLAPVLLVCAAIAIFFFYIEPQYHAIRDMLDDKASFEASREQAQNLAETRRAVIAQFNAFSVQERRDIDTFIAPYPDRPRVFATIDEIARQNSVLLTDVSVESSSRTRTNAQPASGLVVQEVPVSFQTEARYQNFIAFVKDIERSLQLMDITRISVEPSRSDGAFYVYEVDLHAYSL